MNKEKKSTKFVLSDCDIPTVWCGISNKPPKKAKEGKYYYKTGTRTECLRVGFGAGTHIERNNNLPSNSLQQIKYVGEKHEKDFKTAGISTNTELIKQMRKRTTLEMEKILKRILVRSDGVLDARAYNSVVVYLYKNGIGAVPACKKISAPK
jgi:hypothetical protein